MSWSGHSSKPELELELERLLRLSENLEFIATVRESIAAIAPSIELSELELLYDTFT